jgi:hypothetical protein
MFRSIKGISNFFSRRNKCSKPICAHCEVDIAEVAALAITSLLDRRINQVLENSTLVSELKLAKTAILRGDWHEDYNTLREEKEYVVI